MARSSRRRRHAHVHVHDTHTRTHTHTRTGEQMKTTLLYACTRTIARHSRERRRLSIAPQDTPKPQHLKQHACDTHTPFKIHTVRPAVSSRHLNTFTTHPRGHPNAYTNALELYRRLAQNRNRSCPIVRTYRRTKNARKLSKFPPTSVAVDPSALCDASRAVQDHDHDHDERRNGNVRVPSGNQPIVVVDY